MSVAELFMPYALEQSERVGKNKLNFAHYTSAFVATEIIEKEEVWLRNCQVMNDFSEVKYGADLIAHCWNDQPVGEDLRHLLRKISPQLDKEFENFYSIFEHERHHNSYILSLSEHAFPDKSEDEFGRLSMWRAYGGDTNVALVIDSLPLLTDSQSLHAYASPVLYADRDHFIDSFEELKRSLEVNFDSLVKVGADEVKKWMFWAFHWACLSTKHPGFSEEREWRLIYSPILDQGSDPSPIRFETKTVGGIPQRVALLPLKANPDIGYDGFPLDKILTKIIIGPTETPGPIKDALVALLEKKKVTDAESRVTISEIPLRR